MVDDEYANVCSPVNVLATSVAYVVSSEHVVPLHVKSPKSDDASCVGPTSSTVRAPPEFVRPVPSRLLKDEPLTMRLVVEAWMKALIVSVFPTQIPDTE